MQEIREEAPRLLESGTPAFHRMNLALFAAGFVTFATLYSVQPLLPVFSEEFRISAAESSLALSLTTGLLAFSMLVAGSLSDVWGRKPVMVLSLMSSAALTIVSVAVPSWHGLLLARALMGVTLGGLPAVAMTYVSEEVHPKSIGLAMGLFIGGNAIGGMAGRLVTGFLTDLGSWRFALGCLGAIGLVAAVAAWRSLPPAANFRPRRSNLASQLRSFTDHIRDPGLCGLCAEAFLLMGSFVTIYNYLGYRLAAPPYGFSQTAIGAIFVVYLIGTVSSTWVGDLAGRLGRRKVLWAMIVIMLTGVALTLFSQIVIILAGITVTTFGFFGAHSVASSWVGRRAQRGRAQASALYLFCYYAGSSIVGSIGGLFWSSAGWWGVTGLVSALLLVALAVALWLATLPPAAQSAEAA